MGLMEDVISDDAGSVFMDTDGFASTVIYTPYGKPPKTIIAVVVGSPPQKFGATPRSQAQIIDVWVSRVDVPVPNVDGDSFVVNSTAYRIVKLIDEQDPGVWHLQASK
jgi:hypothetical protein